MRKSVVPIQTLIARSSLGTSTAHRVRAKTPRPTASLIAHLARKKDADGRGIDQLRVLKSLATTVEKERAASDSCTHAVHGDARGSTADSEVARVGKIADATFVGASGTKYSFAVYSVDTAFKDIGAVYVFSERTVSNGKGSHHFLYVGQTEELGTRIGSHEKWLCAKRNGVNALCVHVNSHQGSRLSIETDLRKANDPPCNEQ